MKMDMDFTDHIFLSVFICVIRALFTQETPRDFGTPQINENSMLS